MTTNLNKKNVKIKILIISSLGPKPYVGGIENVIDTLLNSDLKESYDFYIFDTYRKPDPNRKIFIKVLFSIKLFINCIRYLHKTKPDIVHIHFCSRVDFWKHSICLLASKTMKIKTVFHCHGGSFDSVFLEYNFVMKSAVKTVFKLPNIVIALSDYWYSFLLKLTNELKIKIVPNPINCNEFSKYSVSYQEIIGRNIILVGSIGKRKGHFDTIKAMPEVLKQYPDAKVLFAGTEEDIGSIEELKKISKESGIIDNVYFLGAVAGTEKYKLFGSVSIVILPSYGENMPISVLEGMAAHRPVIASRVGALPELFGNEEFGLLINPGDWKELAVKIVLLLKEPEYAEKLGENGYSHVKDLLDVGKIIKILSNVYSELL
jgi:glycosyltransferase involved in cell wall biosynthesis